MTTSYVFFFRNESGQGFKARKENLHAAKARHLGGAFWAVRRSIDEDRVTAEETLHNMQQFGTPLDVSKCTVNEFDMHEVVLSKLRPYWREQVEKALGGKAS